MQTSHKTYIAVDVGATNIRVALVNEKGDIIANERAYTPHKGEDGQVVSDCITGMAMHLLKKFRKNSSIAGIGIASCGPLDYKRGGTKPANLPFAFIPLIDPLRHAFDVPVTLHNDANAAALGEARFGAGRKKKNIVYITLSTGIGAGAIVDGNLLIGATGNAAEVGHMTIDTVYEFPCGCAKGAGHWEGYCSGKNMPRFFDFWKTRERKKVDFSATTAKDIFTAAREGKHTARDFLDEISRMNARAVSNILVAYDPELITIGGSVALHNARPIIAGIKKYIEHYLYVPPIQITKLGEDITLLGSVASLLE